MATLQELIDDLVHYAAEYAGEHGTLEDKRKHDALEILVESTVDAQEARIAALEQALSEKDAEIARLRVKADRYDWLRAGNYPIELARSILNDTPHGIDAAIDAAQGEKHAD